jgi:hypothetical protein
MTDAVMNSLPAEQRAAAQQAVFEVVQDKIQHFLKSDGHAVEKG